MHLLRIMQLQLACAVGSSDPTESSRYVVRGSDITTTDGDKSYNLTYVEHTGRSPIHINAQEGMISE